MHLIDYSCKFYSLVNHLLEFVNVPFKGHTTVGRWNWNPSAKTDGSE